MATAKIGAPNWIEPNWCALTLGGWGATSTLDNIKNPDFGLPAISTDATTANTQFAGDFSALSTILGHDPQVDCLFIPKHNFTAAATIDFKLGTAAFTLNGAGGGTVTTIASGVTALTATLYAAAQRVSWAGGGSGAADPVMDASYNRGVFINFGGQVQKKYFWLRINDTANPDGKISISRLFLGPYYTPTHNIDYGATLSLDGTRVASESLSGSEWIDPNRKLRRVATLQFSNIPSDEAASIAMTMSMYLGYARQALFIMDPSDTVQQPRRQFMCVQKQPSSLAYRNFGLNDVTLTLMEVL